MKPNQGIRPRPVPYRHEGSTYGADSIRITGTPDFVDSVLSRLKDMLEHENGVTRLQVSYKDVEGRPDKPAYYTGNEVACYIQVHERGGEAQILAALAGEGAVKNY
ncbi:MAG: hypothetical protein ACLFU6_12060 [Candidatus Hydrogenedentota bacterium]